MTEKPGLLTILANGSLQVFKYFCKRYLLTTIEIFQYSAFPAEAWRSDTHDLHVRFTTLMINNNMINIIVASD